jgi:hypothetical protein
VGRLPDRDRSGCAPRAADRAAAGNPRRRDRAPRGHVPVLPAAD